AAKAGPPIAPVHDVKETYFGHEVVDPYRWMEKDSAEFSGWMKAEADYTRAELEKLPTLAALRARVTELDNAVSQVDVPVRGGRSLFYLSSVSGSATRKLFVRDGVSGAPRLLVDPDNLADAGKHATIDYYRPSQDGRYVAFGVSQGGSEMAVLHVVETKTGRLLPDVIDRARLAHPSWVDGRSFFYRRSQKLPPDTPPNERFLHARVYLHVLGKDAETDVAVFGQGVSPNIAVPDDSFPIVLASAGAYVLAIDEPGTQPEIAIYAARKSELAGAKTPWRKIAGHDDQVVDCALHADALFLLSHKDAPRFKLLRVTLPKGDLAKATVVVPESDAVLDSISPALDAVYVREIDGGVGRLFRVPYRPDARPAPALVTRTGSVAVARTDELTSGALAMVSSWTTAPAIYAFDPKTNAGEDTHIAPPSPVRTDGIVSEEVKAKSADGTMVPLSIIHGKALAKDGSHPTWLRGYGAYGVVWDPWFEPMNLAWLERGGVVAVCHPRGGGEYGDAWHRGGQLATKPNTVADFLACAHYLVDQRITSPAHLAGEGTSAGGILIGGAITAEPELFGAAVIRVGMTNALRFEQIPIGPFNTPEFGSVKTEEGFRMLLAIDAFHHVKDKTAYPAVLVTTGIADPRVSPWQSAKIAARLQAASSSGRPVLLRVDYENGHGIGASRAQREQEIADEFAFLLAQLGGR
ncbi:MAG TPA: prolyl oligopeptidase family serine peptidase, partial [Minicystis sp.]|nr:prolyl oligopeptidase family serine peptidase [Minicystis sp.]